MRESHSKLFLLLESIVFLAPLTLLASLYASLLASLYWHGLANEPWDAHIAPGFTLAGLASLVFAWRAVVIFLFHGRAGIAKLGRASIFAIHLGAALAIMGGASLALLYALDDSIVLGHLSVNAIGLPAIIPFAHIALERRKAVARNPPQSQPPRG